MSYEKLFRDTYRGKRVLLTGHTGFKGSWLLAWLKNLGAIIQGYALLPEENKCLYNLINGDELCNSIIGDIRDKENLKRAVLDFEPDFIFHLAAQPLVLRSYEIPSDTFEVNAMGTVYLLEALRLLKKPCVVVLITTDKVYENKEWQYPYRENDRLGGYDPYSASKAVAELVVSSYRSSFFNIRNYVLHGKAIATARAGNVIGGGDWSKDRIIPDIVRALQASSPIGVRNPLAIRPWQHVLEPLAGYLLLGVRMQMQPEKFSQAWNFGPLQGDTFTVQELVQEAISVWGSGFFQNTELVDQPHEAGLLKLDINKALYLLEWKPKWNAQKAIKETISFYKSDSLNSLELISKQINDYQSNEF